LNWQLKEKEFNKFRSEVIAKRGNGKITLELKSLEMADKNGLGDLLDKFVESLGLNGLATKWKEIDEQNAIHLMKIILCRDLAYNAEIMDKTSAVELVKRFLDFLEGNMRFFTNGNFHESGKKINNKVVLGASWDPITHLTFDTGVICVGGGQVGIFWVEDED
jgi:hypothetical protein